MRWNDIAREVRLAISTAVSNPMSFFEVQAVVQVRADSRRCSFDATPERFPQVSGVDRAGCLSVGKDFAGESVEQVSHVLGDAFTPVGVFHELGHQFTRFRVQTLSGVNSGPRDWVTSWTTYFTS